MSRPDQRTGPPLPVLTVAGFRCFCDETAIELRPLTLLYGHNQAGKSTLLRLLPFLADSLAGPVPAMDWQSPSLGGASFKELGWLGPEPVASPWLTVRAPDGSTELALQFTEERGPIVNAVRLGVAGEPKRFDVSYAGDLKRQATGLRARYDGVWRGRAWSGPLSFSRPLPGEGPPGLPEHVAAVDALLQPIKAVQWLHANRLPAGSGEGRPARWCRSDGSDLATLLLGQAAVVERASAWLSDSTSGRETVFVGRDSAGHARLELRRPGSESLPLHLAGEGIRALLPIVAAVCAAEVGGDGMPSMLAVEEPEAHLHPNLQVGLMRRLIATVGEGVPVVLETHSAYLLRAVQLAVLQGGIPAEDVGLYWVEQAGAGGSAAARRVRVADDARLEGWLPATFEEEQRLAYDIVEERWRRTAGRP